MADILGNGGSLTQKLVVGFIFMIASALGGGVMTFVNTLGAHGQRITVIETQMQNQSGRLERIEGKLDKFLEHEARKP